MKTKQLSLSTARWIALAMYFCGLVVYPVIGAVVRLPNPTSAETLRVLGPVLLGVGVVDYIMSLAIEGMALAQARKAASPRGNVARTAIVTGAFGESLAVFGLILTFLGARSWGTLLYGLCFVHGVHLMLRWPNFEQVAAGDGM